MLCVDVNVLVDAYRVGSVHHGQVLTWLDDAVVGPEPIGVLPDVAASFLRVVTNRRVFSDPTPLAGARAFVDALLAAPSVEQLAPSRRRWEHFTGLVDDLHLTGDDVTDAFIAAGALDVGATLVTSDRGFRRFPRLRIIDPSRADAT